MHRTIWSRWAAAVLAFALLVACATLDEGDRDVLRQTWNRWTPQEQDSVKQWAKQRAIEKWLRARSRDETVGFMECAQTKKGSGELFFEIAPERWKRAPEMTYTVRDMLDCMSLRQWAYGPSEHNYIACFENYFSRWSDELQDRVFDETPAGYTTVCRGAWTPDYDPRKNDPLDETTWKRLTVDDVIDAIVAAGSALPDWIKKLLEKGGISPSFICPKSAGSDCPDPPDDTPPTTPGDSSGGDWN